MQQENTKRRKEGRKVVRFDLFICNAPKMDKVAKPPEEKGDRIEFKRDQAPGMGVGGGEGLEGEKNPS
jgi:hypothetical protein